MSESTGDPYPITLNPAYSGILMGTRDTASATPITFLVSDFLTGLTSQHPLISQTNAFFILVKKVEIWGPIAGMVQLMPHMQIMDPYSSSTSDNTTTAYTNEVDVGNTNRRPYLTFTWPEPWNKIGGIISSATTVPIFQYLPSSGATSFGTYSVIYIHFMIKSPNAPVAPQMLRMEAWSERDEKKRKRLLDSIDEETERQYKIAKLKSLTLPELMKE